MSVLADELTTNRVALLTAWESVLFVFCFGVYEKYILHYESRGIANT